MLRLPPDAAGFPANGASRSCCACQGEAASAGVPDKREECRTRNSRTQLESTAPCKDTREQRTDSCNYCFWQLFWPPVLQAWLQSPRLFMQACGAIGGGDRTASPTTSIMTARTRYALPGRAAPASALPQRQRQLPRAARGTPTAIRLGSVPGGPRKPGATKTWGTWETQACGRSMRACAACASAQPRASAPPPYLGQGFRAPVGSATWPM